MNSTFLGMHNLNCRFRVLFAFICVSMVSHRLSCDKKRSTSVMLWHP